jgi:hypothetical protein
LLTAAGLGLVFDVGDSHVHRGPTSADSMQRVAAIQERPLVESVSKHSEEP